MLLSRLIRSRRDDRGSALMGVIALIGVTGIIAATIGTVAVGSLQTTNGVAASVQARAAADAGISIAEIGVRTANSCASVGGVYQSSAAPAYRVQVAYDTGTGWRDGCPPKESTRVRFLATGYAARPTFGASRLGATRVIEAIYNYVPEYVRIPVVDPAVYAYTVDTVLKKFVLESADNNVAADLQIKSGDFECSNGAKVAGALILGNGYANLSACTISGTIHATKYAYVTNGSHVYGDVIATGSGIAANTDVVRVSAGSRVDGGIYAGGNVSVLSASASQVLGSVTAARDVSTRVTIATGSTVFGNVISSGTVDRQGTVGGTTTTGVSGLSVPPSAQVGAWTDLPYQTGGFGGSNWMANGFTEVMWSGDCSVSTGHAFWASLANYTTPIVVNALACGAAGISTTNNLSNLVMQTDIAFIANKFTFQKLYAESSNVSVPRDIYLVVPDNTADRLPTCTAPAGDVLLTNEADIKPSVSAFVYTPCRIYSDRNGWRGQLYGGEVEFGQQAKMLFVPTAPPGVDFTGGIPPVYRLDSAHLGGRVIVREVSSGG